MNLTAAATTRDPTVRFAAFLAGAVILHVMLLLLPAERGPSPGNVLNRLSVSLRAVPKPAPEVVAEPVIPEPAPTQPGSRPAPRQVASPADTPPPTPPPAATAAEPARGLSTARLLDDANRIRWRLPEHGAARSLGEPAPGRAGQPPGEAAPAARIEIVDRWLAADGSHNVLVRTASGDLLCGRADAWDPMRPMVEPVMMFRTCGSAGPTFEWPDRYRDSPSRSR